MKKTTMFGVAGLVLLSIVLSGCTGQAYVASVEPQCKTWKQQCDKGNRNACNNLKNCIDVYTKAEIEPFIKDMQKFKDVTNSKLDALNGKADVKETTVRHISRVDRDTVYGKMTCQELCQTTKTNKGEQRDITNQDCLFGIGYENKLVQMIDHDMCGRPIRDSLDRFGETIACVCG